MARQSVRRLLFRVLAWAGALLAIVSLTPVNSWWARALAKPWDYRRGDVLIVLAGDVLDNNFIGQTSYWRSVYAVLTWREGGYRRLVLSGDGRTTRPMLDFLVSQGIPHDDILVENQSADTHDNAVHTAILLRAVPGNYELLTSDYHMFRAWRAFRKAGVETLGQPFPDALKRTNSLPARWTVFCDLATETAKIAWYKWRGWI